MYNVAYVCKCIYRKQNPQEELYCSIYVRASRSNVFAFHLDVLLANDGKDSVFVCALCLGDILNRCFLKNVTNDPHYFRFELKKK